jgi:hypothetical protein
MLHQSYNGITPVTFTNTPVTFTNWNTGEPNNYNNVEFCTEIISSQLWNDINW